MSLPILIYELGVIPTHISGFFCNDPALSFPFRGDTVPMAVLVATVVIIPPAVVFITEVIYNSNGSRLSKTLVLSSKITGLISRDYFYGFVLNLFVIELLKGLTGMPRPTFFDLCEPDTGKTCVGSEFVSEFKCTSTSHSQWLQQDAYHSFPSGHTSLSVYAGWFAAWYLQTRAFSWSNRSALIVPLLQVLLICYAVVCSFTRITDHRHHWWDVAIGAIIGAGSTYFAVSVLSRKFECIAEYGFKEEPETSTRLPISDSLLGTS